MDSSKIRRCDCLLIAFLPTIKYVMMFFVSLTPEKLILIIFHPRFTLTLDELSRPSSSLSRSSSTSSFAEALVILLT